MKKIKLTQGQYALIDDEDFDRVKELTWHALKIHDIFYAGSNCPVPGTKPIKFKNLLMHRFLMGVTERRIFIDHIDHNGLNNQKYNLRKATDDQNRSNRKAHKGSSSKYVGVSKYRDKWVAIIGKKTGNIFLGRFICEEEAAIAYNEAAKIIHEGFGNMNILPTHITEDSTQYTNIKNKVQQILNNKVNTNSYGKDKSKAITKRPL